MATRDLLTGQTRIDPRVRALIPDTGPVAHPMQGVGRLAKALALSKVIDSQRDERAADEAAKQQRVNRVMALLGEQKLAEAAAIAGGTGLESTIADAMLREPKQRRTITSASGRVFFEGQDGQLTPALSDEQFDAEQRAKLDRETEARLAEEAAKREAFEKSEAGKRAQAEEERKTAAVVAEQEEDKEAKRLRRIKAEGAMSATREKGRILNQKIAQARQLLGRLSPTQRNNIFGARGAVSQLHPGSNRRILENIIDTMRAIVGFEELREMRATSPTGGALGQVTERELAFLQSVITSLNLNDEDQFIGALSELEQHSNIALRTADRLFEEEFNPEARRAQPVADELANARSINITHSGFVGEDLFMKVEYVDEAGERKTDWFDMRTLPSMQ